MQLGLTRLLRCLTHRLFRLACRRLRLPLRLEFGELPLLQQLAGFFRLLTLGLFRPGLGLRRLALALRLRRSLGGLAFTFHLSGGLRRLPFPLNGAGLVLALRGRRQGRRVDHGGLDDLGADGLFLSPIQPGGPGQGEDAEDQVQGEGGDQGARMMAGRLPHVRAGGTGCSWPEGNDGGGGS